MFFHGSLASHFTICALCVILANGTKLGEYSDKCQPITAPCNHASNLDCRNNVCICTFFHFYDKGAKACIPMIGNVCNPQRKKDCAANAVCEVKRDQLILPKSVQHAIPNGNAADRNKTICQCSHGFVVDELWHVCKPVSTYEKSCDKKSPPCDVAAGLVCAKAGTCTCDGVGLYDKKLLKCVYPLGAKCKMYDQCEEGAICSNMLSVLQYTSMARKGLGSKEEAEKLIKSDGACVCPPGLAQNSKGKCAVSFRVACSKDIPCNDHASLTCADDVCQCEAGMTEVFDANGNASCRIIPGRPCDPKKGPKCAGQGSKCEKGHCTLECKGGLSLSPIGACLQSHGTSCDVVAGKLCNNFEGLACIDGKCACFDSSLKWNKKGKVCGAELGKRCGKFKIFESDVFSVVDDTFYAVGSTQGSEHYYAGCVDGFSCTLNEDSFEANIKQCRK